MIKNGEILEVHRCSRKVVYVVEIGFPYHDEIKKLHKEEMVEGYYKDIVKIFEKTKGYQTFYKNPEFISSIGHVHAQAIDMNFKFNYERIDGMKFDPMLYVQKESVGVSYPHNHISSGSSISTTFYIDPPESGGEIQFYISPNELITVKTKPNVLYVFPSWLHHAPLPHSGTETRVCVNVDYFTLGRAVFIHEQKWGKENSPERRPSIQGWINRPYSIW
mgnify:FL=1